MRTFPSGSVIGLLLCACGGTGGGSGTGTPAPPAGAAPALVQTNSVQTGDAAVFQVNTPLSFTAPTKAGDTIWVAATVPDFSVIHTISVTDTQGNAYTRLDQQNDLSTGTQSVAHFYAANIHGDTATPDVVTVNWSNDNYKGVLIAEISGVTQAPLVGHAGNIQRIAAGVNNVKAGPVNVATAQTPALLLALGMNTSGGTSDTGGSGAGGPAAGSGLTPGFMLWDWGANLATFATGSVTSAESVSSLFSAPHLDSYVTVVAVFH